MPNRILKESINESRSLTQCSFVIQDFYKRLITYADDYGRFNADEEIMRARLYPRELDVVSLEDLQGWLIELAGIKKIAFFTSSPRNEIYGCFPNWHEHQRVRSSRKKIPDPEDTTINDWYLRRFVPIDMKAEIIERDRFKCTICNKYLTTCTDAKRIAKLGENLFHIDHIIPVSQGGRATMENLRLTCPTCNLERKRYFTIAEILEMSANDDALPQVAASCRELPPESNPIQSESNPNLNPNPIIEQSDDRSVSDNESNFDQFWEAYPKKVGKKAALSAWKRLKVKSPLFERIMSALEKQRKSEQWLKDNGRFIPNPTTWLNGERWDDEVRESKPRQVFTRDNRGNFSTGDDYDYDDGEFAGIAKLRIEGSP